MRDHCLCAAGAARSSPPGRSSDEPNSDHPMMHGAPLRLLVALALAAVALLAIGEHLAGPPQWTPDGLFYEARALELGGVDEASSLEQTFGGSIGAELRGIDPERSGDPAWSAYHERFYERRVSVPLAAKAIEPVAGERALLDVSIAGYVAAVLAVFGLLLLRFALPIAAGVALLTVFLPALTHHAAFPQTDSWGLALETAALACGVLALQRGPRWIVPWFLAILVLSFTRDSAWIPILAAGVTALILRSRVSIGLVATGVAAVIPVLLLYSTPTRELLATMLNEARPNPEGSWGFIASRYPDAVIEMLHADGGFVLDGAWYSAMYLLTGVGLLFALGRGSKRTPTTVVLQAAAAAGALFVLLVPVFSAFRLELVLVPMAAFGLALGAEWASQRVSMRVPSLTASGMTDRSSP